VSTPEWGLGAQLGGSIGAKKRAMGYRALRVLQVQSGQSGSARRAFADKRVLLKQRGAVQQNLFTLRDAVTAEAYCSQYAVLLVSHKQDLIQFR
jgi:hypothetical protein